MYSTPIPAWELDFDKHAQVSMTPRLAKGVSQYTIGRKDNKSMPLYIEMPIGIVSRTVQTRYDTFKESEEGINVNGGGGAGGSMGNGMGGSDVGRIVDNQAIGYITFPEDELPPGVHSVSEIHERLRRFCTRAMEEAIKHVNATKQRGPQMVLPPQTYGFAMTEYTSDKNGTTYPESVQFRVYVEFDDPNNRTIESGRLQLRCSMYDHMAKTPSADEYTSIKQLHGGAKIQLIGCPTTVWISKMGGVGLPLVARNALIYSNRPMSMRISYSLAGGEAAIARLPPKAPLKRCMPDDNDEDDDDAVDKRPCYNRPTSPPTATVAPLEPKATSPKPASLKPASPPQQTPIPESFSTQ